MHFKVSNLRVRLNVRECRTRDLFARSRISQDMYYSRDNGIMSADINTRRQKRKCHSSL